jgi:hypothetical protein
VAFAVFYNMDDLQAMAEAFVDASISGKDRNDGRTYWNNGLSGWQNAPLASADLMASTHPDIAWGEEDLRLVVVQNNTLASLRQYLYFLYAKYPNCVFLQALANDLTHPLAVIEPWPWIGPPADPWAAYR